MFAKRATAVELVLFDRPEDDEPARVIELVGDAHRTGAYWHAFVPGIGAGQAYGFRAHGPWAPERGLRFDGDRVLIDPYGRGLAIPDGYRRRTGSAGEHGPGVDDTRAMKSVVVDLAAYDWEGDRPLDRPFAETVIYEAHVKGFTAHPNSGVDPARRGTYAGFIDKIPYLVDLGVTAVELLPVFAFDAQDAPGDRPNYWGYQPVSFFAPHGAYSSRPGAQGAVDEFRDLVKALHRAGLEVILDVVYNHTAEGGDGGPTFAYRGLANEQYYLLDRDDRSRYADFSGTGNTLNANEPIVRRMIIDSLRYWVVGDARRRLPVRPRVGPVARRGRRPGAPAADHLGHRDRPDPRRHEAHRRGVGRGRPVPGRVVRGRPLGRVERPLPRRRPLVRQGRPGQGVGRRPAPARVSPDIYEHLGREPQKTINFVTCHDGFTLNDVVSYDRKHNEANGEDNRDGNDANLSLELRRRGPDRRPGDRGAARAPGEEPAGPRAARGRRADADDGRRGAADAARQQQRLLPGLGAQLVRLEPRRAARRPAALLPGADRRPAGDPGPVRRAGRVTLAELLAPARASSGTGRGSASRTCRTRRDRSRCRCGASASGST